MAISQVSSWGFIFIWLKKKTSCETSANMKTFTPQPQYPYFPYYSLLLRVRYWKGEFLKQSKLLRLTIICYFPNLHEWFSLALLWGEIRCWSPLRQCEFLVQYFTDMQNCLQFLGDWQGWYCNESIWLIISLVSILSMMLHGNWVHCKFSSLPKGFFFRFLISLYQQNSTFQIPIQQVENSGQQSTLSGCPC